MAARVAREVMEFTTINVDGFDFKIQTSQLDITTTYTHAKFPSIQKKNKCFLVQITAPQDTPLWNGKYEILLTNRLKVLQYILPFHMLAILRMFTVAK